MIDYGRISRAVDHYVGIGYTYIEAPWLVSKSISDITRPEGASEYFVNKGDKTKVFVASGEQSLLYLIVKGYLPLGNYVVVTPCLRDDTWSGSHSKQFMKVELMNFISSTNSSIQPKIVDINQLIDEVTNDALRFMTEESSPFEITCKETQARGSHIKSYDIEANWIEVGSYGYRRHQHIHWIYGTGLAEPRFSNAIRTRRDGISSK